MSEAPEREWRFYVEDMIACAEKVVTYTAGLDLANFVASGLNYDATLRNIELIGEAATRSLKKFAGQTRRFPGVSLLPQEIV